MLRRQASIVSPSPRNIRRCYQCMADTVPMSEYTEIEWTVFRFGTLDIEVFLVNRPLYFLTGFPFVSSHFLDATTSQHTHDVQVTESNVTYSEATLRRQESERLWVTFTCSACCVLLPSGIRNVHTLFQLFAGQRKDPSHHERVLHKQAFANASPHVFRDRSRQCHVRFHFSIIREAGDASRHTNDRMVTTQTMFPSLSF